MLKVSSKSIKESRKEANEDRIDELNERNAMKNTIKHFSKVIKESEKDIDFIKRVMYDWGAISEKTINLSSFYKYFVRNWHAIGNPLLPYFCMKIWHVLKTFVSENENVYSEELSNDIFENFNKRISLYDLDSLCAFFERILPPARKECSEINTYYLRQLGAQNLQDKLEQRESLPINLRPSRFHGEETHTPNKRKSTKKSCPFKVNFRGMI